MSVSIPSLPLSAGVANSGNTTNVTLKTPSAVAMTQGQPYPTVFTVPIGYDYSEDVVAGANYLFTLYNPPTYLGKDNRLYLEPALLTVTTFSSNRSLTFRVLLNAELTDPVYNDILSGVTPAQVDEVATAYTSGIEVLTFTMSRDDRVILDIAAILENIKINADNQVTLIAESTGTAEVTAALTFRSRV